MELHIYSLILSTLSHDMRNFRFVKCVIVGNIWSFHIMLRDSISIVCLFFICSPHSPSRTVILIGLRNVMLYLIL